MFIAIVLALSSAALSGVIGLSSLSPEVRPEPAHEIHPQTGEGGEPAMVKDRRLEFAPGRSLRYQLVTPEGFDPAVAAPVMLLLPPGAQDRAMVDAALRFVAPAAQKRGWVIVCPEAIDGVPFTATDQSALKALVGSLRSELVVEHGRVHVAGISNGGRSAIAYAIAAPDSCASIFVFPGAIASDGPTRAVLGGLAPIPVRMYVGAEDSPDWREAGERAVKELVAAGVDATLEVRPGQPHVIRDLSGDAILDTLDGFRRERPNAGHAASGESRAVEAVLDALHSAATRADGAEYFALFAPDAVFIGTDATERWTIEEFRAYAEPLFEKGLGWEYHPRNRNVSVDAGAGYAFFDELLDNTKYGECRGTGVLRRVGDRWMISQYHLTVPIPNDLLPRVAGEIRRAKERPLPR